MAFAFLDRVLECDAGERVVARKALSLNEEFFADHFPGMPVLPGAMILEGFVQAARHCLSQASGGHPHWTLDSVSTMRFNRFARPGEILELELSRDREEEGAVHFKGRATVDGEGVCRLKFAVREAPEAG
jgi:3-hydroxyacyl-[acyl-carrier-protein] dehydratase